MEREAQRLRLDLAEQERLATQLKQALERQRNGSNAYIAGAFEVQIEVFIDKNVWVQIEVHGVKGKKYLAMTEDLKAALGGEIEERKMKPEAYETVQEEVQLEERRRIHGGK